MPELSISINGRNYLVACDPGQEVQLEKLGSFLDKKMRELSSAVGTVGEARLLVMAALLISDELFEARRKLEESGGFSDLAELEEAEASMAGALDAFAERIEAIAERLDRA